MTCRCGRQRRRRMRRLERTAEAVRLARQLAQELLLLAGLVGYALNAAVDLVRQVIDLVTG